jgi:SAM-dependent methyltransferase
MIMGFDDCVRGRFDAITFVDVLYRFPIEEWDGVLLRCRARLRPGGMLLIKEHDPTARLKNGWNRVQEWFTDRVHLTLGESFAYEAPREFLARLERLGFADARARRVDFGYPHPHILYTARLI